MSARVWGGGFRSCRSALEVRRADGEVGAVYLIEALKQQAVLRAAQASAAGTQAANDGRPAEDLVQAL